VTLNFAGTTTYAGNYLCFDGLISADALAVPSTFEVTSSGQIVWADVASTSGTFSFNVLVNGVVHSYSASTGQGFWLQPAIDLKAGDVIAVQVPAGGAHEVDITLALHSGGIKKSYHH